MSFFFSWRFSVKGGYPLQYISNEAVEKAKSIDLLTYLKKEDPYSLVPHGNGEYCLRLHDSLKISNALWHWFSHGIGGRSALDYLIKVEGFSFMDAVKKLSGDGAAYADGPGQKRHKPAKKEKRGLALPPKHKNNDQVFQYLTRVRGIDPEIVKAFIKAGAIYESRHTGQISGRVFINAVFVGRDEEGAIRQASVRGIGSGYKSEVAGSDKRYSFSVSPEEGDTAHVYESAIDLGSYLSILKEYGKPVYRDHHISLSGIYLPSQDEGGQRMPPALGRFLETHPEIQKVVLHLDNDVPGRLSASAIIGILAKNGLYAVSSPPVKWNDVNDYLLHEIRGRRTK